jgi:hypothetical protein
VVTEGNRYLFLYRAGMRLAKDIMRDDTLNHMEVLVAKIQEVNLEQCAPPKEVWDVREIAARCCKETAKDLGNERSVVRSALDRLSHNFHIFEQVEGRHWSGKRMRIDAIIKPKDDSEWMTKSPSLGLEFKNFRGFASSFDMKDYTRWWVQCHDYAETDFDGHGLIYVFSYNGFSHYRSRTKSESAAAFAERFWGRLGVGELEPGFDGFQRRPSLTLRINGTNKIWTEDRGVRDGRRMSMERKFGSR